MLRGNELKRVLRNAKVNREEKKSAFSSSFFFCRIGEPKKKKKEHRETGEKKKVICIYMHLFKRSETTHSFFLLSLLCCRYCVCVCFETCSFFLSFLRGKDERIEEAKSRCVRGESCVLDGLRVCLCHPSPTVQVPLQRTN